MARIGYARVSSRDQNLDSQIDMLQAVGCEKIFQDKASGVRESRPEWDKLQEYVRLGDTIVVAELSRMTRSLMHLLKLSQEFEAKGISVASLRENIDTSTATGRAFFSIIGAINQGQPQHLNYQGSNLFSLLLCNDFGLEFGTVTGAVLHGISPFKRIGSFGSPQKV